MCIGTLASSVYRDFKRYESLQSNPIYLFKGSHLGAQGIDHINEYVRSHVEGCGKEQGPVSDVEQLSEYYPYRVIEEAMDGRPLRICNIGCFCY